jgi:hypothetical protein
MDFTSIRAGDELVVGPLTGVRLWTYGLKGTKISSFQYFHVWSPAVPTVDNEPDPTMENGRGLNVYKSEADALRGSADAIRGVQEGPWHNDMAGIVLGAVEFWGPAVECEFGYAAKIVKPTLFLRAWGARANSIVGELNVLWFGDKHG